MKKRSTFIIFILIIFFLCFFYEKGYSYGTEGPIDEETAWTEPQKENTPYILKDFDAPLTRGEYNLTFEYENIGREEVQFQLVDASRNDGNNNLGFLIAQGSLDPDTTSVTIPFELEEDTYSLQVRCTEKVPLQYWRIELVRDYCTDGIVSFILLTVLLCIFYWKLDWKKPQYAILLTGVAVLITLPLVGNLLMNGHDLTFHLSRVKGVAEALSLGQFPVRMNMNINQGYGFVSEILYPNLFVFIPAILYALGVSLITAYKIWILFINIATALVGYYSFKGLLKSQKLGAVCAFLYLINPYRLNNIFLRAAIGEVLAEIFLPLLVFALFEMLYGDSGKWKLLAISAVGILQSHILTLEMSVMFGVIFCIISWRRLLSKEGIHRIGNFLKAVVVSVALNLWFLVPFLDHFTKGYNLVIEEHDVTGNYVFPFQMFLTHFKVTGIDVAHGMSHEMPMTIGIVLLLGSIIFLYYAFGKRSLEAWMLKIGNTCLLMGAISCFMATEYFPWRFLQKYCQIVYRPLSKLQYLWRMLGFASLFLSIVTAIAIYALHREGRHIFANALIIFSAVLMLECMDGYMTDGTPLINSRNQDVEFVVYNDYYRDDLYIGDMWHLKQYGERVISSQDVTITDFEKQGTDVKFHFERPEAQESVILQIPLYNYELHRAYINGQEIKTDTGKYGLLNLKVPEKAADGDVEVIYVGRKLYKAADIFSLMSAIIIVLYYIVLRRKNSALWKIKKNGR